jgi:enoyl-CoA hydratase
MSLINFSVNNYVGLVTINRPEVLNCLNYETLEALEQIVGSIRSQKLIRAVIFTGAGTRAFSTGADLKERRNLTEAEVRRNVRKIREVFNSIDNLPQPTIAAINGYAFGGGLELALACDFRIAVEHTKMGLTETSMAIIPGAGGTQRLPRLIGESKAMELILTAQKITSEEALQYGLINRVVKQNELHNVSTAFAELILNNGPIAVQQAKFAIKNGMNASLETGLSIESRAYEVTIPTKDRIEALNAFNEKRPPNFRGE